MKYIKYIMLISGMAMLDGAAAQSYTRQSYQMTAFGCNANYANASAVNPTSVTCQAVFKRAYVNQSDSNDAEVSATVLPASFDLLANPTNQTTVNVGGSVTVTDAQLAALIRKRSEAAAGL